MVSCADAKTGLSFHGSQCEPAIDPPNAVSDPFQHSTGVLTKPRLCMIPCRLLAWRQHVLNCVPGVTRTGYGEVRPVTSDAGRYHPAAASRAIARAAAPRAAARARPRR